MATKSCQILVFKNIERTLINFNSRFSQHYPDIIGHSAIFINIAQLMASDAFVIPSLYKSVFALTPTV